MMKHNLMDVSTAGIVGADKNIKPNLSYEKRKWLANQEALLIAQAWARGIINDDEKEALTGHLKLYVKGRVNKINPDGFAVSLLQKK